jgi:hypothetical protein
MDTNTINKTILTAVFCLAASLIAIYDSCAANIYVDQTLTSDCTAKDYSIANRACTGTVSDGNAYRTIQSAINSMNVGDTIMMRGGTYLVKSSGTDEAINIPVVKNGNSWAQGHFNTLKSYPGEWAKIDGQGSSSSVGVVLGLYSHDKQGLDDLKFWVFEKFEVTGGTVIGPNGGEGSAIWANGGPNKFRYLYIHDNWTTNQSENPVGLTSVVPHDSTVEYCVFKHNGCGGSGDVGTNCAHIAFYTSYLYTKCPDLIHCVHDNVVRYNYMEDAIVGVKHKAEEILASDGTDMVWKTHGDNWHHNIIRNSYVGIMTRQDFAQVYNNIVEINDQTGAGIETSDISSTNDEQHNNTYYNNTIYNGTMQYNVPYGAQLQPVLFHPYWWAVNNILDHATDGQDGGYPGINAGVGMVPSGGTVVMTNAKIDRNLFYQKITASPFRMGRQTASSCTDRLATAKFNSCYTANNWDMSGNGLYLSTAWPNKYVTNGSFKVSESMTIANGGVGIHHPYLSGVNIPSYVGATNPNDNAWVAGVFNLSVLNADGIPTNLRDAPDGDPSWIEASVPHKAPSQLGLTVK